MSTKKTKQEISESVYKIWGEEFIVIDYKNSKELLVKDVATQNVYKVTVANFIVKRHDPRKFISKKNKNDVQKQISSIYGDEFVLLDYIDANNLIIIDKNNNEYHTTYSHLIKERKNPKRKINKYSLEDVKDMISERSNNTLSVVSEYNGMKNDITIECNICGNRFVTQPTHIVHEGTRCPYCAHEKVSTETCIYNSPYKNLFEDFLTKEQMLNYMPRSMRKIEVTCPICKRTKLMAPDTVFQQKGIGCVCGDGISYPNKFMYSLLTQCDIEFEREKTFSWSNNRKYDFYIKSKNLIIEMHGSQHYDDFQFKNKKLLDIQKNDKYKKELALKNLQCKYIEINASKSNIDFIKSEINKSNLLKYLEIDESYISYEECDKFAIKHNLLQLLVNEYNNNTDFSLKAFANDKKISLTLAYKLLNQAIKYSLITGYNLKSTHKTKVRCVETGKIYDSITEASKKCHANVGKALKKKSLANKCHWEIVE